MKFNFLFKSAILFSILVAIISCAKDFNQIGSDVLGDNDHFGLLTDSTTTTIAYNQPTGAVQTNNLPINTLGFYLNSVFGKSTSNYVTQLELAALNPVFIKAPADIVIDSVYLHVPYFYKSTITDAVSGDTAYTSDSLIGSSKIKIDVYRNGFFLENLDSSPGGSLSDLKKYYSDDDFSTNVASSPLNNGIVSENDEFEFKNNQIKFYKNDAVTVRQRLAPGLFMMLDKTYFQNNIIQANPINLSNNNLFKDYFRGLYFKVSPSPSDPSAAGALNRLNFAQGKITIIYQDFTSATDSKIIKKSIVLNLAGNAVNTFVNNYSSNYTDALAPSYNSTSVGASRLFLKGGQGSMAVISLFGGKANGASNTEIQKFRDSKSLINDATLTFTIDKTSSGMTAEIEPRRIYLFDLDNKKPLLDYYTDFSTSSNPKFSKIVHGGIIKLNSSKRGTTYQIKLTNHIQNMVRDTVTYKNVKLGLVVTEDINVPNNYSVRTPFSYLTNPNAANPNGSSIFGASLPVMSFVNPLGTILYGTNLPNTEPKKLKLVIRYSKPE